MHPQAVRLKRLVLDSLFPRYCVGCNKEGEFLCPSCIRKLETIEPPFCPRCGMPQQQGSPCPDCIQWQQYHIDGIRSPYRFEGVIRQSIHQFKYQNLRGLASPLANLMSRYLKNSPLPADALIAVPIHRKRLRERGYNQSGLLARDLGKLTGIPVLEDCLFRQKFATPQARTGTAAERIKNVENAFICRDSRVKGMRLLLIDDVATSGATLNACATALSSAGAVSVWGLALAREI